MLPYLIERPRPRSIAMVASQRALTATRAARRSIESPGISRLSARPSQAHCRSHAPTPPTQGGGGFAVAWALASLASRPPTVISICDVHTHRWTLALAPLLALEL